MRGSSLAALAACLLTITLIGVADAQRQRQTTREVELMSSMRAQPVQASLRFRATSAASRAAAARRLGVTSAGPDQMGDSFLVTPRNPFIADRAAMKTWNTSLDAAYDTTGPFQGYTSLSSDVNVRIYNAGNHRFLVECTVEASSPLVFRMLSVEAFSSQNALADVSPSNGRISFVTHHIWDDAQIGIRPTASQQTYHSWYLTGCEFTALPT